MASAIFVNGKFFVGEVTGWEETKFEKCMVVEKGLVEFIGDEASQAVSVAKGRGAAVHDVKGRTVLPAFMDGHIHILLMGESLQRHSLERCKSLEDIRAEIRAFCKAHPDAPRVLCRSWMHIMTDGRAEAAMLDDLDPRPIYITSKDLHSCWCNTAALKELDIESIPDPAGGKIHRDDSGRLSGLISESAVWLVYAKLTQMSSMDERLAALRTAIRELNKSGYTGLIDMATDELIWDGLLALREAEGGRLPMRIAAHWLITPNQNETINIAQVDRAIELHRAFNSSSSPDLRITGIKVICDGVIDACTAALREPYLTTGGSPEPLWTPSQLRPVVRHADRAGLQVALHAIGDAAVHLAIDTLTQETTPGRRHRIEHLELTAPGDATRLAAADITASVQPVHADPAILRYWPQLLGPERCARAFAYAEFAREGAKLALGSDAPTAPWDPLRNLYTATTRRSAREPELQEVMNQEFALRLCEAVAAATAGVARSCFADTWTGSLARGLKADFVIVDMQWDAQQLLKARVCETWFEGAKVFDAEDWPAGQSQRGNWGG